MALPTWLYCVGLVFLGTCTTITSKIQYQIKVEGRDGVDKRFDKPWLQSFLMFLAMALVLIFHYVDRFLERKKYMKERQSLLGEMAAPIAPPEEPTPFRTYMLIAIPALFDTIATTLGGIGLIWTTASVFQMLRGSLTVFGALLSIRMLKRRFVGYQWMGILVICLALAMVGFSSVLDPSQRSSFGWELQLSGIGLIIAGQFVQALQMVVEEHLLKNVNAPPLLLVGSEGIWGTIIMIPLMIILQVTPSCDNDSTACSLNPTYHEDSIESFEMIGRSEYLMWVLAIYVLAIVFFNIAGIGVTAKLSAVHRTVLEALRILGVWTVDLFFYYALGPFLGHSYMLKNTSAEKWSVYSWLELGGFFLLIFGSLLYNRIIEFPKFFYYPPVEEFGELSDDEEQQGLIQDKS
eukprot:GCRY01000794.1.p1 GENE.GCRY01000794.1~~GCRY01000794.1.p1  ORF type:complete len:406 (-),score=70.12 GCRY01000794.1:241-1458(-)